MRADGSSTSGLAVVVPLWLEHAADMPGGLPTRQCAAALVQLLQLRHHPALAGLSVPGRPAEAQAAQAGGRVTRAKARQQGGLQFSLVPAPAKVLMVLGALLTAEQESAAGGDTAWARSLAAEWADDEDDDGDDDGDDDDSVNGPGDMTAAALHAAGCVCRGVLGVC